MLRLEHRIPPPVVGILAGGAMWVLAAFGPSLSLPPAATLAVVIALIGAGISFDIAGILAFRRARTTVNPLNPEKATALVTGGVYRITRNPMYVGIVFFLLAWAVHLGAVSAFAGPIAFMLYIARFQIRPEERALRDAFGAEFEAYSARVRRWL